MKGNWFWWFKNVGLLVIAALGFAAYQMTHHWVVILIAGLTYGVGLVIFDPDKPKPAREAYAEYLERERVKLARQPVKNEKKLAVNARRQQENAQKLQAKAQKLQNRQH